MISQSVRLELFLQAGFDEAYNFFILNPRKDTVDKSALRPCLAASCHCGACQPSLWHFVRVPTCASPLQPQSCRNATATDLACLERKWTTWLATRHSRRAYSAQMTSLERLGIDSCRVPPAMMSAGTARRPRVHNEVKRCDTNPVPRFSTPAEGAREPAPRTGQREEASRGVESPEGRRKVHLVVARVGGG